jgi:hypothetical protein
MGSSSDLRATSAFRDGVSRVNSAPLMLVGMCLATLLVALPLALVLEGAIARHLGGSLAAESAAEGTNFDWWQEFAGQASGLAATFVPSIIGFGAVLDNLDALADNLPVATTIAVAVGLWLVIWSFLSGGVLDRYARDRPTRAAGFFAASGTNFWRFLRLGVLALAAYGLLFGFLHGWLLDDLYGRLTKDMTAERGAFAVRAACYALFGAALVAVNLIFDYARVRIVVEDRRSAVGAVLSAVRFVRRNRGTAYLYVINALAFLMLVLMYALVAPGAPASGPWMWITLGIGQLYIVARHYLKLLFYASELAFFQNALAHAAYTAAPIVVWPESPAAEAILNADAPVR